MARQPMERVSILSRGQQIFLGPKVSIPALGFTKIYICWVMGSSFPEGQEAGCEVDSLPSTKRWGYKYVQLNLHSPYASTTRCLTNTQVNWILHYTTMTVNGMPNSLKGAALSSWCGLLTTYNLPHKTVFLFSKSQREQYEMLELIKLC